MDRSVRKDPEVESPGIRLIKFLTANHMKVIARERNNERFIHLYGAGEYWSAFEQSAYQLSLLFPDGETTIFHSKDYPFPVIMVSITDDRLRGYARRHILRTVDPDYKILMVPELVSSCYGEWRRAQISEFM